MNTVKRILIPIDLSESSIAALKYASKIAQLNSTIEFFLVHVKDESTQVTKKDLDHLISESFDSKRTSCHTLIKSGDFINTLIEVHKQQSIDLVILGTAGSIDETIPSKTSLLIQNADFPILIIPASTSGFSLNNIVLAIDQNEMDNSSDLRLFHDIAKWYNAKVHLVTVNKRNQETIALGDIEKTIEYYMESIDYRHAVPKNKDIEEGIMDYIKEKEIDMLAIMPKHHAKNIKPSNGRLTRLLAAHSRIPLLVID